LEQVICRELVDDYYFFPLGFKCDKAGLTADTGKEHEVKNDLVKEGE